MNCQAFEPWIALDAGGDLPAADAEALARHLATCVACRRFVEGMRESRRAVSLLAEVPIDKVILAAVQTGVLDEVDKRSVLVPFRLPPTILALAAALALVFGALFLLRSGVPSEAPEARIAETPVNPSLTTDPEPTTIELEPDPPALDSVADPVLIDHIATSAHIADVSAPADPSIQQPHPAVAISPPIPTSRPTTAVAATIESTQEPIASEPMVIKLVSENADVVIYWLVNSPETATKES